MTTPPNHGIYNKQPESDVPPKDDVEELQADWAACVELVGQGDGYGHLGLVPQQRGHQLGFVVRETVWKVENHPIEGTDLPQGRLVAGNQRDAQTLAFKLWTVRHLVLIECTVGSVPKGNKVRNHGDCLATSATLVLDVLRTSTWLYHGIPTISGWGSTRCRRGRGGTAAIDSHLSHLFGRWLTWCLALWLPRCLAWCLPWWRLGLGWRLLGGRWTANCRPPPPSSHELGLSRCGMRYRLPWTPGFLSRRPTGSPPPPATPSSSAWCLLGHSTWVSGDLQRLSVGSSWAPLRAQPEGVRKWRS